MINLKQVFQRIEMKTFKCEEYSPSKEFQKYLEGLPELDFPISCQYLRRLPEDIKIEYNSGPPRKYEKEGLFCTEKAKKVINAQCSINQSPVRIVEGGLGIICSEERLMEFPEAETSEITEKERKHFLNDRR